jgi:hypothetical protein
MPSDQLLRQLHGLSAEVGAEQANQQAHNRHAERVAEFEQRAEMLDRRGERVPEPMREARDRLEAERRELPEVRHEARAKEAVIESVLADRERLAAAAARTSPPGYIKSELGERPSDPTKAREWDKAVRGIEGYRLRNGIRDRDSALGGRPKEPRKALEHDRAQRRLQQSQRQLNLKRARERHLEHGVGHGIGR